MIYFILLIVALTIILYLIYRNFIKVLKITSIVTGISGVLTLIIGYLLKYIVEINIDFINISKVIDIILTKFLRNSVYLFILSLIEWICYVLINYYFNKVKK